jgi:hypothetical protein
MLEEGSKQKNNNKGEQKYYFGGQIYKICKFKEKF